MGLVVLEMAADESAADQRHASAAAIAAAETPGDAAPGDRGAEIGERLDTFDQTAVVIVPIRVRRPVASTSTPTKARRAANRLPVNGSDAVEWHADALKSAVVRVEVRHPDGQIAALTTQSS
jgi:hypothetical protein